MVKRLVWQGGNGVGRKREESYMGDARVGNGFVYFEKGVEESNHCSKLVRSMLFERS